MPKRQTQPLTSLRPPEDVSLATAELPASSAVEASPRMAASLDAEEPTHVMAAPVARAGATGRVCPRCQSRYTRQQRFCPFDGQELRHASWHPERDELVGKVVAERYAVEELLAEGGMGIVQQHDLEREDGVVH